MGTNIFGIGVSGLNAAQAGLAVTSHNIASSDIEGYHRQKPIASTQIPQATGSGYFGRGVTVETVLRDYNRFLEGQVLSAETQSHYYDTYLAQVSQIDNLLADPASGLSPALQGFFSAVQDVASNPASIPSRQALLSEAQSLIGRFDYLAGRLSEIRAGVNTGIADTVASINTLAAKVADLNRYIVEHQAIGTQPPNDLLDQRDALIAQVNQLVRTSVIAQSDGTVNLFIGNGQSLVIGTQAFNLVASPSLDDPQNLAVSYQAGAATVAVNPATLQGGVLGALLAFRSDTLDPAQNALGRIAVVLAQSFNDQHRLGQDLNGALGTDFFNVPAATVVNRSTNTGTAVITAANTVAGNLTASDYRLSFNAGIYTLTRLSDNTQQTFAALPQTIDGFTITLASGAPANGDSFLIEPTRFAAENLSLLISDTALIAAAAPVRTGVNLANTGSATISAGAVVDTTNPAFAAPGALTPPILIQFTSASQYSVYDNTNPAAPVLLEAGIAYTPGAQNQVFPTPGALDYGYRVSLTGAAAAGDRFTVGYNTGGVSDNRNALLLAGLQTALTVASGTADYQSAYSQIVSQVGNRAREMRAQSDAQSTLVRQTREAQQSISGVNLDEEAANLIRYQQAYQASGKVLQIASKLFDTILELGN